MFTGIVGEIGIVSLIERFGKGLRIAVSARTAIEGAEIGDSLAVNGVCLTLVETSADRVTVEAVEETILRTTLGRLRTGCPVNLERALIAGGKLGGHYVQGHVDLVSTITSIQQRQESWIFSFSIPSENRKYLVPKGSIAVDGVSLTIFDEITNIFRVSVIPHTFTSTLFSTYRIGSEVNLEFDIIGKYVLSFLENREDGVSPLSKDRLADLGY